MTTAQIVVGSAKSVELQDELQKKLEDAGYATEGDTVMAEFILVMLANQKTPSQITAELTDLIGPEYESNFTDGLFRTVAEIYAPPPVARPQRIETVHDSSAQRDRFPRNAGGSNRGASGGSRNNRVTPYNPMARNQARDFDALPLAGGRSSGRDEQSAAPIDAPKGPRSIFERVDLQQARAAHMPISRMQGNGTPQQINFAVQQQMGMNYPQGGAFNPRVAPAPQYFTPQQHFGGPSSKHQRHPMGPTPPIPGRPTSESLCKFGVGCKNAWCENSHPSPVATVASGLVLSTEPCEKQLFCNDPDCPKAHISQQARNPALSMVPPPVRAPAPSFGAGSMDVDGGGPSKAIPCRYGNACTRPGCYYSHPWESKGGSATVCKFGEGCTKPDCHFRHPAGRAIDRKTSKNKTAVFPNGLSAAPPANGMGALETSDSQMSERLKRFAQPTDGPVERILPGSATEGVASKDESIPMEA